MALAVKESQIQRAILDYLTLMRIFHWKQNTVGIKKPNGQWIPSTAKGVSDILAVWPTGMFVAIEVKVPGGKPTPDQEEFLRMVNANHGLGFVATGVDDVIRNLPIK